MTTRIKASKLAVSQIDISEARQFDFDNSMFSGEEKVLRFGVEAQRKKGRFSEQVRRRGGSDETWTVGEWFC